MGVSIHPIRPGFVAEVGGLDLSCPISPQIMEVLWAASDTHAVLIFRGQHLTDEQQIAFAENWGRPERYVLSYRNNIRLRLSKPEMVDVSNLDAATGQPLSGSARHRMVNLGNRLWHTDSSFKLPRGGFSMLFAHAVPPPGPLGAGETEFADTVRRTRRFLPNVRRCWTG